jgi:carboxyl-terminal processing protease
MTLPPPDPFEPAPVEPVVTPPTTPDAAADPFTSPVDVTGVAVPVAPLASVSPAEPRREGRRFGSPVLVMVALFAFAVGIFVDRGLTAVGSLDLSGVTAGAPTPVPAGSADPSQKPTGDDAFALIRESWDLLHKEYVGASDLDDQSLAHAAINGMTEAVGDEGHTTFLTPDAVKDAEASLSGEYVGIGTIVDESDNGLRIEGVFPDSPADKAGLGVGDEITAVDGVTIVTDTVGDVAASIRGAAGTTVKLTIDPAGPPGPRDVTLTRANVTIPVVDWAMVPDSTIADVRLYQFSNGAIEKLMNALKEAKAAGAKSLVLDLRGNPGGFVDQAIGVASQFLGSGDVFITEDADGNRTPSKVRGDGEARDLPLTILVDRSTASAAEIVASAIQEQRDVKVVGEKTFGTGTVLNRFGLKDGSALEIGVQRWLTPSGRALWHEGLTPDQSVSLAEGVEPISPRELRDLGGAALQASKDAQLLAALKDLGWP